MKIFVCFFIFISAEITAQDYNGHFDFKYFYYLEGEWIIPGNDRYIHEKWVIENDTLLTSVSFYVSNNDTANAESVSLVNSAGDIFYIPEVEHNPSPVKFKLVSLSGNKAVFINPGHDFPTKITYKKISEDSLHASIEGEVKGKLKVVNYPFKRKK